MSHPRSLSMTATILNTFKKIEYEKPFNFRGLSTPSLHCAWASGGHGLIVRTVDSGETWERLQIPGAENCDLRDIKAFDENTAYAMSTGPHQDARIYKTEDGGQHWLLQLQGKDPQEFFNCLAFWDKKTGLVLSDPVDGKFKIYKTVDGKTWNTLENDKMPPALKDEGAFAASGSCMTTYGTQHAWFGTGVNSARIFYTHDGGQTWDVSNTPMMQDSSSAGIFSVAFFDAQKGFIVGGDYAEPAKDGANFAFTEDGGLSWQLKHIKNEAYWSAVALSPDKKTLIATGPTGSVISRADKLDHWTPSSLKANAVSFWSEKRIIAVGIEGSIQTAVLNTKKLI